MHEVQVLARGAVVALLMSVVSSTTAAAPLQLAGHTTAGHGWLPSAIDVPDPCAQRVIACRPGQFEAFEFVQRTVFARFSAQIGEALGPVASVLELQSAVPVARVLYTDALSGASPSFVIPAAGADAPDESALFDGVAVLVQEMPEPPVLVTMAIALMSLARARRR